LRARSTDRETGDGNRLVNGNSQGPRGGGQSYLPFLDIACVLFIPLYSRIYSQYTFFNYLSFVCCVSIRSSFLTTKPPPPLYPFQEQHSVALFSFHFSLHPVFKRIFPSSFSLHFCDGSCRRVPRFQLISPTPYLRRLRVAFSFHFSFVLRTHPILRFAQAE
jgi:hypothetical protein